MENASKNKMSTADRLYSGEKVKCVDCMAGVYVPVGGTYKDAHIFKCDKCGSAITFTPNIIIK